MRKLIVWNLVTLDGYFEGDKPWDLEFHALVWGSELERMSEQFGEEGDLLVFGRRTYEGMAAYWTTVEDELTVKSYMNAKAKIAVSRSLSHADWNNTRVVSDPVRELKALKEQDGKTIFIFGSALLMDTLLEAGLIDEIRLCLVPVILGSGTPLFKPGTKKPMRLLDSRPLETGGVILRYEPVKA